MKYVFVIIALSLFGLFTPKTFAETSIDISNNGEGSSSEVHVESSTGESTTCVNGNCSTTQNGSNTTTVCINGRCEKTQGNVNRQEGGAKVKVENNSSVGQVEGQAASESAEASDSAKKSELKQKAEQGQFNIEEMIDNIRKFFSELLSQ